MSDKSIEDVPAPDGAPSDAPTPVLIVVACVALIALAAELWVGVTSAFAPAVVPHQVATAPVPATPAPAAPATPAAPVPEVPVQVPPTGG